MEYLKAQEKRRALQQRELELLQELKRICGQHRLTYFLVAGTLLGAVRHKGFIPWDDDIDVAMPRKDFDRMAKIVQEHGDPKVFWQDEHTDPFFYMCFGKLRLNKTRVQEAYLKNSRMHQGIYIDVFPLDRCPQNDAAAKLLFKGTTMLTAVAAVKAGADLPCEYTKKLAIFIYHTLKVFPLGMLLRMRRTLLSVSNRLCSGERLCSIGGVHGFPNETYRRQWVCAAEEMMFEGELFPVPVGWKEALENMYGDYMSLPPTSERGGHFETDKGETI